ncbi:MAG: hypothetical protein AAF416_02490 [Pseudomonadota bacterium]
MKRFALAPLAALLLTACAEDGAQEAQPAAGSTAEAPTADQQPSLSEPQPDRTRPSPQGFTGPQYRREQVPEIYLAVQDGGSAPHSVIFAIDGELDGSPLNDQAVRISPEPTGAREGNCGIQNLQSFRFPTGEPVFSSVQANQGIDLGEMPRYLAFQATQALVATGLAADAEDTVAQNICARKFWEVWLTQTQQQQQSGSAGG